MPVIEDLLADKQSHLQILLLNEEQLAVYLGEAIKLEPKAKPRPLNAKGEVEEEEVDPLECPIKGSKKRKPKTGMSLKELKEMNLEKGKAMFED